MPPKDPQRWQEVIIDGSFGKLTKQDVYDYYQRSDIRNKILSAIRASGSPETILRQSFAPGHTVLRRKDHQGNLIDLSRAKDFNDWAKLRMSEIHPVFGKQTNMLLADIDPGEKVPWQKVKSIAETIAKTMGTSDDVKDVQVQFSGDRGFYVKGILNQAIDINAARKKVKDLMDGLVQRPDITLSKAAPNQIRIDTTPLKNRGSIKAPYSLSAVTGLVAAPVDLKKLLSVQRSDFKIDNIKTAAEDALTAGTLAGGGLLAAGGAFGAGLLPKTVYHGTRSNDVAHQIKKDALRSAAELNYPARTSQARIPDVYVSPDKGIARDYATAYGRDGYKKRLLKIRLPQSEWDKFKPNDGDWSHSYRREPIPSKYIKGGKGYNYLNVLKENLKSLPTHIRKSPTKFGLGAAGILGGLGLLGYGTSRLLSKDASAEFAPGIPAAKTIDPIPSIKNKAWMLSVQQHDAKKAGKHYDVRLVDPKSHKAHSFAVPRSRLPTKRDRMLLAIQRPTHTEQYAMDFEGKIPAGTYGAGQVKIKMQEPISVIKANADLIDFERSNGQRFVLFRTKGNNWGFKRKKT